MRSLLLAGTVSLGLLLSACGSGDGGTTTPAPTATPLPTPTPTPTPALTVSAAAADYVVRHAQVFSTTDPAASDDSDLAAFGDAIGDARIVSLAEPDHGAGDVFDMKVRLVKYLHEKKGFDVIMLESSMFAVERVWQQALQGQSVDDLAVTAVDGVNQPNIFYMYSMSAQGRKLLQYVDSQRITTNPLILDSTSVVGADAQNERTDFLPMLEGYLNSRQSLIPASAGWATYKNVALNTVIIGAAVPSAADLATFNTISDQLVSELCAVQADNFLFPTSPGRWCLMVKGLRGGSDVDAGLPSAEESIMADNFKWLDSHVYATHKIILWGHYQHLGRGTQAPLYGGTHNLGGLLAATYGQQLYVVAFTSSFGNELAWWNGPTTTQTSPVDPDAAGSMEAVLYGIGQPNLFVDSRRSAPTVSLAGMTAKVNNLLYDFGFVDNTTLGDAYDGLFYIQTSTAATMNR